MRSARCQSIASGVPTTRLATPVNATVAAAPMWSARTPPSRTPTPCMAVIAGAARPRACPLVIGCDADELRFRDDLVAARGPARNHRATETIMPGCRAQATSGSPPSAASGPMILSCARQPADQEYAERHSGGDRREQHTDQRLACRCAFPAAAGPSPHAQPRDEGTARERPRVDRQRRGGACHALRRIQQLHAEHQGAQGGERHPRQRHRRAEHGLGHVARDDELTPRVPVGQSAQHRTAQQRRQHRQRIGQRGEKRRTAAVEDQERQGDTGKLIPGVGNQIGAPQRPVFAHAEECRECRPPSVPQMITWCAERREASVGVARETGYRRDGQVGRLT